MFDMMYFNGDFPSYASVVRIGGHGAEVVKNTFLKNNFNRLLRNKKISKKPYSQSPYSPISGKSSKMIGYPLFAKLFARRYPWLGKKWAMRR